MNPFRSIIDGLTLFIVLDFMAIYTQTWNIPYHLTTWRVLRPGGYTAEWKDSHSFSVGTKLALGHGMWEYSVHFLYILTCFRRYLLIHVDDWKWLETSEELKTRRGGSQYAVIRCSRSFDMDLTLTLTSMHCDTSTRKIKIRHLCALERDISLAPDWQPKTGKDKLVYSGILQVQDTCSSQACTCLHLKCPIQSLDSLDSPISSKAFVWAWESLDVNRA